MSEIKERPILFSGPMVRAILEGQKTQTRRIAKGERWIIAIQDTAPADSLGQVCPYGAPGERLWVRENFRAKSWSADGGWGEIEYQAGGALLIDGAPWSFADAYPEKHPADRWRPARFMPRWASRLLLQIESVKVERLNDISEADAIAEGISPLSSPAGWWAGSERKGQVEGFPTAKDAYSDLWDKINGDRANWASNPWVWVVEFKKVEAPHANG
jgi:hypothetical protein